MDAAHLLAWVFIVWCIVASVWQGFDKPVEREWNSRFYQVCCLVVELTAVTLSLIIII